MPIKKLILRSAIIIAVLATPLVLLVTTNLGLNVALRAASWFYPVKVTYGHAEGKIIGQPIRITDVVIEENGHILQIEQLNVDWQLRTLTAVKVTGFEYFLPTNKLLAKGQHTEIEQIQAKIELHLKKQLLNLSLLGKWQKELLTANLSATHTNDRWLLDSAKLVVGSNSLTIKNKQDDSYSVDLKVLNPKIVFKNGYGKLYAVGSIAHLNSKPELTATINAEHFGFEDYELKNFNLTATPLSIIAKADKLVINTQVLTKMRLNAVGNLNKHSVNSSVQYDNYNIQLRAHGDMTDYVWKTNDLIINTQEEKLSGSAMFDLNTNSGKLNLQGKILNANTALKLKSENNNINLALSMQVNDLNHMKADLNLKDDKLSGTADLQAEDLSLVMKFIPELTRLKGKLSAKAKISGTLTNPFINTEAHVREITATFPGLGVKIKPMELHLKSNDFGRFVISGNGSMRRGSGTFTINGYIEPFKANMPNELVIKGTEVEFINNPDAQLIASNDLKFCYNKKAHSIDITGYIEIQKGTIYFDNKKSTTVKSKDVVFIDHKVKKKNDLLINPNINLRILEEVHFTGFNLDADISGKLDVVQRNEAIYATGRVTIKQGTYSLPGQKLEINKGRLLFPPGTLLANPTLDIKMHSHKKDDLEIIVQGTAQKPTIREAGISANSDKAISQALTTSTGMLSDSMTGGKFKLPELSLTNRDDHTTNYFDDRGKHKSSLSNKDLVVGMPLSEKLHIEYLQGLSTLDKYSSSTSKRVRLKYDLHENWAVGVESGDQGNGADLSFSFEKD